MIERLVRANGQRGEGVCAREVENDRRRTVAKAKRRRDGGLLVREKGRAAVRESNIVGDKRTRREERDAAQAMIVRARRESRRSRGVQCADIDRAGASWGCTLAHARGGSGHWDGDTAAGARCGMGGRAGAGSSGGCPKRRRSRAALGWAERVGRAERRRETPSEARRPGRGEGEMRPGV